MQPKLPPVQWCARTGPSAAEAGTTRPVVKELRARDPLPMTKRLAAALLWFYAGWYAGAMIAGFLGISPVIGPILGAAAAGFLVGDPLRIIWTRPAPKAAASPTVETAPELA